MESQMGSISLVMGVEMTKREKLPETAPAETDDARSVESPEADRNRHALAQGAAKGLHRAMKEQPRTGETAEAQEEPEHGKK